MLQAGNRDLTARELLEANRAYYDSLWSGCRLIEPDRFNTWPLVQSLVRSGESALEVAPGLRPRLPFERTQFVDVSRAAVDKLKERGASAVMGLVTSLPFADCAFDLVCALDIIEHVDDDDGALRELTRVAKPGATVLVSVPLHENLWNAFDDFVGHRRRYEPRRLGELLARHGLAVECSAVYGMQPRSSRLLDLGIWYMKNQQARAFWWYNRVFMPLGLKFQKKLAFQAGLVADLDMHEIILVCRRQATDGGHVSANADNV